MKFFEDDVLVVSKKFKGENDILVCSMSRSRGIFWSVAKNGRKSKRRFVNTFEQPSILHGYFRVNSVDRFIVEKVEILENFVNIKSDFVKTLSSWYVLNLSKDLSVLGEVYDLLLETLYKIQNFNSYDEVFRTILLYSEHLISAEGFEYESSFSEKNDLFAWKEHVKNVVTRVYGIAPRFLFIIDEVYNYMRML